MPACLVYAYFFPRLSASFDVTSMGTWKRSETATFYSPLQDVVDAESALTGYVIFRKDRRERRGGGIILHIKESIQAYEITLNCNG